MATHIMRRNCLLDAAFRGIIIEAQRALFATIEYSHRKQNRAVARPTVIRHWRLETMPKRNCTPDSGEAQCLVHTTTNEVPLKRCRKGDDCLHPKGCLQPATTEYFHRNSKNDDGFEALCKDCRRPLSQRRYASNPEKFREQRRQYELYHPGEKHVCKMRGEARRKNLVATFTHEEWQHCLIYWGNKCAYCGMERNLFNTLVQEHFIPQSVGGGYAAGNIIPACSSCNSSKQNAYAPDWLNFKLGKERAAVILDRIEAYFAWVKEGAK